MRVLLINSPYIGWLNDIKVEPVGLLYIAAVLRQHGHEVALWDRYIGESEDHFVQQLIAWRPDIVACGVYTVSEQFCFDVAQLAKQVAPHVVFVAGGPHATFAASRMLNRCWAIDIVTLHEAEESMLEIARCVKEQRSFEHIPGIVFRAGANGDSRVMANPFCGLRTPLDELPFPAKDLLSEAYYDKHHATGVITSRGCAYRCDFCMSPVFFKGVRKRDLGQVADELRLIQTQRDIRHVRFYDDIFAYNLDRLKDVHARIAPLGLTFDCYIRIDCTTPEMLEIMKEAGCIQVRFGVESGGDVQRSIHKGGRTVPFESHRTIVDKCRELGIESQASYILGFPDESEEDILATIDFANQLNTDRVGFYKLTPYPGTIYWNMLDEDNICLKDYTKFDNQVTVNKNLSSDRIFHLLRHAYETYYRNRNLPYDNPDTLRFLTSLPKLRY